MDELNKKFDHRLREELESEKFEFKEAYWTEAAAMIRAKKAALMWKWFGYGAVIIVASLLVWRFVPNSDNDTAINQNQELASEEVINNIGDQNQANQKNNSPSFSQDEDKNQNNNTNLDKTYTDNKSSTIASQQDSKTKKQFTTKKKEVMQDNKLNFDKQTEKKNIGDKKHDKPLPKIDPRLIERLKNIKNRKSNYDRIGDGNGPKGYPGENGRGKPYEDNYKKVKESFSYTDPWDIKSRSFVQFSAKHIVPLDNLHDYKLDDANKKGSKWKYRNYPLLVAIQYQSNIQFHKSDEKAITANGDSLPRARIEPVLSDYKIQQSLYQQVDLRLQKGKFGTTLGLGFGQIKEQRTYHGSMYQVDYDTVKKVVNTSFGPNGNYWLIEKEIDSVTTMVPNSNLGQPFNTSLRYIELPISVFYEHPFSNRFSLLLGLGLSIRKPLSGNYYAVNSSKTDVESLDVKEFASVRNGNINIQANYKLYSNFDLVGRMQFSSPSGSFTDLTNSRYSSRNFGLGITYWIKN